MAAEQITFRAGPFTKVCGYDATSTYRIVTVDWGDPKPKRDVAEGTEGAVPVDEASYENTEMTLTLERPSGGGGELASRAALQTWDQICVAISRNLGATAEYQSPTGTKVTFDLVQASVKAVDRSDVLWHRGFARMEITATRRPVGRGSTWAPASPAVTTINGVKKWASASIVPGDFPALVDVSAAWADTRTEALIAAGPTTTWKGTDLALVGSGWAAWGSGGTGKGGVGGAVCGPILPAIPAPAVRIPWTATEQGWGSAMISARVSAEGVQALIGMASNIYAPVFCVFVDGVLIRRVPAPITDTFVNQLGVFGRWRNLQLGVVPTTSRVEIGVFASSIFVGIVPSSQAAQIDLVMASSVERSKVALVKAPAPVAQEALVSGDTFSIGSSGSLNARTADLGGTWAATNFTWTVGQSQTATDGVAVAAASATATLPAVGAAAGGEIRCRLYALNTQTAGDVLRVGLYDAAGTSLIACQLAVTPEGVTWLPSAEVAAPSIGQKAFANLTALPKTGTYSAFDVRVAIDAVGRWVVEFGGAGLRPIHVISGHATSLAGVSFKPTLKTTAAAVAGHRFANVRASKGPAQTLPAVTSNAPTRYGSALTLAPGLAPEVWVASADTDRDAPAQPQPSSISCAITPRYRTAPEA